MTMDELNPYASPQTDTYFAAFQPEVIGAWRDADTLVLRQQGAVLPRACVKSNRSTGVVKYGFTTFSNAWACLVLPLFFIPFVGFGVAGTVVYLLGIVGLAARTKLWFRRRIVALLVLQDVVASGFLLSGNLLTGFGLLASSLALLVAGLVCSTIGLALGLLPYSPLVYLRLDLAQPDLVRVRGAHPEYLARLPEFGAREISGPTDVIRTHQA